MTNEQILYAILAVAVVIIVVLLRGKIFKVKADGKGFEIDSAPPEQRPGVEVKGAVSRKGAVNVENNAGDGVKAEDLDGATAVTVKNNPAPKP